MTIVKHYDTLTIEVDGNEVEFTIDGPEPYDTDYVWAKRQEDGDVRVTWLVHDNDAHWEWDKLTTEPAEWVDAVFEEFTTEWDRDAFIEQATEQVGKDRVFIVDHFEHSSHHYSLTGTVNYGYMGLDTRPSCVLVVPPDVTEPKEWAKGVLESYSAYVNGDSWGIVTNIVSPDGTVLYGDSTWGYIGFDNAKAEAGG